MQVEEVEVHTLVAELMEADTMGEGMEEIMTVIRVERVQQIQVAVEAEVDKMREVVVVKVDQELLL